MENEKMLVQWIENNFSTDPKTFIDVLDMSPSSKGYIHGAVSELELKKLLEAKGYIVERIKEKPAGGFDEKKTGYKGDFLIHKENGEYYVVECKGLKTNAEFRSAATGEEHLKFLSKKKAIAFLSKYIQIDKNRIYEKGYKAYCKRKNIWETANPGKTYPAFTWKRETPGPDAVDLSPYFDSKEDIVHFIESCDDERFSELAFRKKTGIYKVLQTHKPSGRLDEATGYKIAAPLKSDFSILAVDLYQRIGEHKFVFVNPDIISSSPEYPNHLYQNYIIDIIIPGKKDELVINYPWFENVQDCIDVTKPRTVERDESQLDYRTPEEIALDDIDVATEIE